MSTEVWVYTAVLQCTHTSVGGHLGCSISWLLRSEYIQQYSNAHTHICWWTPGLLHILATVTSTARNTGAHVSSPVHAFIFSICIPGVESLGHMLVQVLFLAFWGTSTAFPKCLHWFTFLPTVHKGSLFSASWPAFVICGLFDDSHS